MNVAIGQSRTSCALALYSRHQQTVIFYRRMKNKMNGVASAAVRGSQRMSISTLVYGLENYTISWHQKPEKV